MNLRTKGPESRQMILKDYRTRVAEWLACRTCDHKNTTSVLSVFVLLFFPPVIFILILRREMYGR